MNRKKRNVTVSIMILGLAVLGCGPAQLLGAAATPLPAARPASTATVVPTPVPPSLTYSPVPRWMILGQPGYNVEILGEKWNYTDDRWGETFGCIDYTRDAAPYVFFEQCFAMVQDNLTFESQRALFLDGGYETLTPRDTFGDVGQIGLLAKRLEDNSEPFIKFFELIGAGQYLLLVEMNLVTDDAGPLQAIYESQAADVIDYVLLDGLHASRIIPRPQATPLSPNQESFYAGLAARLIAESEADALYGGTWELQDDYVFSDRTKVTRLFEDRTNADVRWVRFLNGVYLAAEYPFDGIAGSYQQPGDTLLESSHEYDGRFVLYGYTDGHTYFDAYLLDGPYIYFAELESRTLAGETVADVFTQEIDDFIYNVLMINVQN